MEEQELKKSLAEMNHAAAMAVLVEELRRLEVRLARVEVQLLQLEGRGKARTATA